MIITKSAPIFGTRSHGDRDLQMEWQGKKIPMPNKAQGMKIRLCYPYNKQGTDGYKM